ncbi:hypothetical protein CIB95_13640 [Lottiidibacillus patelloidae]|uniref:Glycine transporter domain-containing protein n=1 Tax=Lottiidibacillus patelloidae TaxID=2670334 RepID=A0A263BR08_9BACI|nr:trimeric intracellular cation channel family protein [Lottiidibacillus patelloidae]OZM56145.1 hypothetical protein CIB95_13640 [Lottiidibacillus patelloidae]
MTWDVLNIIGTIAFALSGAFVAIEEKYDLLGIYVLGLVTAFGGGVIRNLLIGVPVTTLWEQELLLKLALLAMTIVFLLPASLLSSWKRLLIFFDAIGLAAFAVQGALHAKAMNLPISAIMIAAMLTGIGGGIIRDILAGRKPLVLREETYAIWAILAGFLIGIEVVNSSNSLHLYLLALLVICLRLLAVKYNWRLPRRSFS